MSHKNLFYFTVTVCNLDICATLILKSVKCKMEQKKNYYVNLKCSYENEDGYVCTVSNGNNEKFPCQDFSTSLINFNEMNFISEK